jgi:hypothetical protein
MMRVALYFPVMGNVANRLISSMMRYLPDDVEIVETITRYKPVIADADLLVFHNGGGGFHGLLAFTNIPKAVITEPSDGITLSCFGSRDIVFTYYPDQIGCAKDMGVNAVLWPRPCDSAVFYPEYKEMKYDILTVNSHGDWVERANDVAMKLGMTHLVLCGYNTPYPIGADRDYCESYMGKDDDKMRAIYNSARFSLSLVEPYELIKGHWHGGFEAADAEAAFCGTPPVIFDDPRTPHLHYWRDGFARWIKADTFEQDLEMLLTEPYRRLSGEEIGVAKYRSDAKYLWEEFWAEIRKVCI